MAIRIPLVYDGNGRQQRLQTGDSIDIPYAWISSKPTTLSGYGITDGVDLANTQTIGGQKTFTNYVVLKADLATLLFQTADGSRAVKQYYNASTAIEGGMRWAWWNGTSYVDQAFMTSGGSLNLNGELQSTYANSLRMVQGNYGIFWRNDGTTHYMMITASGDQYGLWNALRPLYVTIATGKIGFGNGAVFANGCDFGSQLAASTGDLSKHVALYSANYGINVTSGTINLVSNGKIFSFDGTNGDLWLTAGGNLIGKTRVNLTNAAATFDAYSLNQVVEKSDANAWTYTLPAAYGTAGDAITVVNSGTAGAITVTRAAGVSLVKDGVDGDITVQPGYAVTLYRTATANKWLVL
ncbi:MAG: hypothetical protein HOQ02_10305 [Lysobacter sp.]|nr:hypothetical protein [Lysobacter sp.]